MKTLEVPSNVLAAATPGASDVKKLKELKKIRSAGETCLIWTNISKLGQGSHFTLSEIISTHHGLPASFRAQVDEGGPNEEKIKKRHLNVERRPNL